MGTWAQNDWIQYDPTWLQGVTYIWMGEDWRQIGWVQPDGGYTPASAYDDPLKRPAGFVVKVRAGQHPKDLPAARLAREHDEWLERHMAFVARDDAEIIDIVTVFLSLAA